MILRPIYFGCDDDTGHYFYGLGMVGRTDTDARRNFSWIDGVLCPPGDQREGLANLVHGNLDHQPWTILAFWDRSVDSRPGSNSVFILPGTLNFPLAIDAARLAFPAVWKRFTFPVVEWLKVP